MNKRVILIVVIFIVALIVIVSCNSKNNTTNSSGESTKVVSDSDFESFDINERFKEVAKKIYDKYHFNKEDVKSNKELKEELGIDSLGECDVLFIKNPEPADYKLIALIAPKEATEQINNQLLLSMIKSYELIKSENSSQSYLRESKNLCIKQQGGISIYIVSKDASGIYDIISSSEF